MRKLLAAITLWLVSGCGGDAVPLNIRYQLTSGDSQTCPSTSCADITITCDSVVQIRIVDPNRPEQAYVSACFEIDDPQTLCEIAQDDLPEGLEIPRSTAEVQVSVYPRSMATIADDGSLRCPTGPTFGADGLPTLVAPVPALGGRAFVDADTEQVVVQLGCTDLSLLNQASCVPQDSTLVTAAIEDFETRVFVSPAVSSTLSVSVGEPFARIDPGTGELRYVLDPGAAQSLPQSATEPVPAWQRDVPIVFGDVACLQVLEDAPQATTSLSCRKVMPATDLSITGYRVSRDTVLRTLNALALPNFPSRGLVLGLVVDHLGSPAAGIDVTATEGSVLFLSPTGTSVSASSVTTASGLFVSVDAAFTTGWNIGGTSQPFALPVGGLVNGKLTVVLIQLRDPIVK